MFVIITKRLFTQLKIIFPNFRFNIDRKKFFVIYDTIDLQQV